MTERIQRRREEMAALRDHLDAELGDGWRPIETAPKDGSRVILWDGGPEPYIGFCADGWWEGTPTDWMPLPAPPARDGLRR